MPCQHQTFFFTVDPFRWPQLVRQISTGFTSGAKSTGITYRFWFICQSFPCFIAELYVLGARGEPHSLENLVILRYSRDRTSVRTTGPATWYCTSMLRSIDRVSADPVSHDRVCRLRCRPIVVAFFSKLSAEKLPVFNWSQAQFKVDFFARVTNLLFEVNFKFIYGSLAFSLG